MNDSSFVRDLLRPPAPPAIEGLTPLEPPEARVVVGAETLAEIQFGRRLEVGGRVESWLRVSRPRAGETVFPQLFAGPHNVFFEAEPEFTPDTFDDRGQVMDSVEPARHWLFLRRPDEPPFFWLIGRLGTSGIVRFVEVSTEFHDGNHAQSVEVFGLQAGRDEGAPPAADDPRWVTLVPRTACEGHSRMLFSVPPTPATYVKVHDHPDGGIARVKLYEEAKFPRGAPAAGRPWLARSSRPMVPVARRVAAERPGPEDDGAPNLLEGARVVFATNAHYSAPENLLAPGAPAHMGDAWQCRREYAAGAVQFVVIEAEAPIAPASVLLDMRHFKLNNPVYARVLGLDVGRHPLDRAGWEASRATPLTGWVGVKAHAGERLPLDVEPPSPVRQLLIAIAPCGGLARVRAFAVPARALRSR